MGCIIYMIIMCSYSFGLDGTEGIWCNFNVKMTVKGNKMQKALIIN